MTLTTFYTPPVNNVEFFTKTTTSASLESALPMGEWVKKSW